MDPAEDIKEDVPISKVNKLMKNNYYNKKLEDSIKHKIEFIKRGEKYVTCLNYNEYYIEWHAVDILDPACSLQITNKLVYESSPLMTSRATPRRVTSPPSKIVKMEPLKRSGLG